MRRSTLASLIVEVLPVAPAPADAVLLVSGDVPRTIPDLGSAVSDRQRPLCPYLQVAQYGTGASTRPPTSPRRDAGAGLDVEPAGNPR
jgi:hypothetical protein